MIVSKHFMLTNFLASLSYSILIVSVSFSHPITPSSTTESSFEIISTPPMSPWHSHASPRSQMSLDYQDDENEAFLPLRRVFSFDEWNEPPTKKTTTTTTPQVFSFNEWNEEPGDHDDDDDHNDEDNNHDDHDHHSYTTPPVQAFLFNEATQRRVSTYNTSATQRRSSILKDLVPLETTTTIWQSEYGGDNDKTTPYHCRGIPRCSSPAHNINHDDKQELATILVDIRGFWPLGMIIEFENKNNNDHGVLDEVDDDDDVSTMMAESSVTEVTEIPPQIMQEPLLLDDSPLRPRRLAFGRHPPPRGRGVQQRLVQLAVLPWNCWTTTITSTAGKEQVLQVGPNRPCEF
jgi:hypothetical protein